jgi:hypothetical protein
MYCLPARATRLSTLLVKPPSHDDTRLLAIKHHSPFSQASSKLHAPIITTMHFLTLTPLFFALPSAATLLYVAFPHLLIPLVKDSPNHAYGTKNNATVSGNIFTELSFDVPRDIPNVAICRLNFHVNTSPLKNAPKEIKGAAPFQFHASALEPTISKDDDTWYSHPPVTGNPMMTVKLGSDWSVTVVDGWFECPFGKVAQFLLHPTGEAGRSFSYSWFELNYPWTEGGPHGITLEMHS